MLFERRIPLKDTMELIAQRVRAVLLVLLVIASLILGGLRLMKIQIVNGTSYLEKETRTSVYTQTVSAARGEIVDSKGNPIVQNKIGYNVIVEKAFFPTDTKAANACLLRVAKLLLEDDILWNDTLPISLSTPYTFDADREDDIEKLKTLLNLNSYASADNCMDKLIEDYEIDESFTVMENRIIAGIRYEMLLRNFSVSNRYTFAEDIPAESITRIKELRLTLPGFDVVEEAIRSVAQGDVLPHEIGTVGPIYSTEEFNKLKENGHEYLLSDTVGKSGLELALEKELCGVNGTKEITYQNGEVVSAEVTKEAVGGNTVALTVNSEFQRGLQTELSTFIHYLHGITIATPDLSKVSAGAIVVLDVNSNAVLGMATEPTYNLNDLLEHYSDVLNAPGTPLVNRATDGLYRPGSTFKTITATAGLNEGIINTGSTFYCARNYKYIDMEFHCTGFHSNISVSRAIQVSCNIFFYELGQRLGIDRISQYATMYGLGQSLGLESGDSAGYLATPETYEKLGMEWYVGNVLQAAIGQSEIQITPLQMAVAASTIANEGVRYQPHLVSTIYNNAMTEVIQEKEPVVAKTIPVNYDYVYRDIEQGMIAASQSAMPAEYTLKGLGFDVAIKTGTPQSPRGTDSFFIGYAPADNPEIAFAGVIEGGEYSKYLVRKVLEQYAKNFPDSQIASHLAPKMEEPTEPATTTTAPLS